MQQRRRFTLPFLALLGVALVLAPGTRPHAASPGSGRVFVGVAYGAHVIYRVDYAWDGAGTLTTAAPVALATLAGAADYAVLPDRRLLVVGQGALAEIDLASGAVASANPGNNGNTLALDPDGSRAWVGWKDTPLAEVPLQPLGDGSTHPLAGDDAIATQLAFTPDGRAFYVTGGELPGELGNVGRIDLANFHTTRIHAATDATSIHYDAFSNSLVFCAQGKAHQVDADDPAMLLSSRDDNGGGENYLGLIPDGAGHLLATRWGAGAGALVLIDYSASGLIGGPGTLIASAPLPAGLSGSLAIDDPYIFADGFESAPAP